MLPFPYYIFWVRPRRAVKIPWLLKGLSLQTCWILPVDCGFIADCTRLKPFRGCFGGRRRKNQGDRFTAAGGEEHQCV